MFRDEKTIMHEIYTDAINEEDFLYKQRGTPFEVKDKCGYLRVRINCQDT